MKFIFRGLTIITYNPENQTFKITPEAAQCRFITEDVSLMVKFFVGAEEHQKGYIETSDLKDVIVD